MLGQPKEYKLEELEDKLTIKERIFCHVYIVNWNGTKAAKKAGYSENSATEIAHENLRKPHIKQYIAFIKEDIVKEARISKLVLISELKKLAFSNIAGLHKDWIKRKDFDSLTKTQKASIQEIDSKIINKESLEFDEDSLDFIKVPYTEEYVKVKLYDKVKAITEILKSMGWNEPEKIDHTSGGEKIRPNITVVDKDTLDNLNKLFTED